ncbi:MAG: UPF0175 family protein [Pyrinomonadaceae bacterium]|nr:UPF0175 family protein [Pyrinomonadaceae bacterium]
MHEVILPISEEALIALKQSPEEAAQTVRFAAAVKLYEIGKLSSGAAASLAGVPRAVFLSRLSDYNVATFQLTEEELKEDLLRA